MTKKHFIALADAVRNLNLSTPQLSGLADFCQSQNPQFNRQRWIEYLSGKCGKSGGKVKGSK